MRQHLFHRVRRRRRAPDGCVHSERARTCTPSQKDGLRQVSVQELEQAGTSRKAMWYYSRLDPLKMVPNALVPPETPAEAERRRRADERRAQ